jgi:hypothetical protein
MQGVHGFAGASLFLDKAASSPHLRKSSLEAKTPACECGWPRQQLLPVLLVSKFDGRLNRLRRVDPGQVRLADAGQIIG